MKHNVRFLVAALTLLFSCSYLRADIVTNMEGKCGYADSNGNLLLDYSYDFISEFSEQGVAVARIGDKVGLVSNTGKVLLPAQYDDIADFDNGCAVILKNDKMGLVNTQGEVIMEPSMYMIRPFNEQGLAVVVFDSKAKEWGLVNIDGKVIIRANRLDIRSFDDKKTQGVCISDNERFNTSSGYFIVRKHGKNNYHNDIYNVRGECVYNEEILNGLLKELFPGKVSVDKQAEWLPNTVLNPSDDMLVFRYSQLVDKNPDKCSVARGFYDLKKHQIAWKRIIPAQKGKWNEKKKKFDVQYPEGNYVIKRFHGYLSIITQSGDNAEDIIINTNGEELAHYKAKGCALSGNQYIVVQDKNTAKYGILDTRMNSLVPCKWDKCSKRVGANGCWVVADELGWGVIDTKGQTIVPCGFDKIVQMQDSSNLLFVKKNGLWGAYLAGEKLLECRYDSLMEYIGQTFVCQLGNKVGLYSLYTKTMSEMYDGYHACLPADNELHAAQMRQFYIFDNKKNKVYGFLDGTGTEVLPFIFNDTKQARQAYEMYKNKPTRQFTPTDNYRLLLYLSRSKRTYKLTDIVPQKDWDY